MRSAVELAPVRAGSSGTEASHLSVEVATTVPSCSRRRRAGRVPTMGAPRAIDQVLPSLRGVPSTVRQEVGASSRIAVRSLPASALRSRPRAGGASQRECVHRVWSKTTRCRRHQFRPTAHEGEGVCDAYPLARRARARRRSEEHTSELQSLMRISYAVFCLKKKMDLTEYYFAFLTSYTFFILTDRTFARHYIDACFSVFR